MLIIVWLTSIHCTCNLKNNQIGKNFCVKISKSNFFKIRDLWFILISKFCWSLYFFHYAYTATLCILSYLLQFLYFHIWNIKYVNNLRLTTDIIQVIRRYIASWIALICGLLHWKTFLSPLENAIGIFLNNKKLSGI